MMCSQTVRYFSKASTAVFLFPIPHRYTDRVLPLHTPLPFQIIQKMEEIMSLRKVIFFPFSGHKCSTEHGFLWY